MRTQETTSAQTGTLPSTHLHTYSDKLFFHHLNSLVPSVQPVKGIYYLYSENILFFCFLFCNELFHIHLIR